LVRCSKAPQAAPGADRSFFINQLSKFEVVFAARRSLRFPCSIKRLAHNEKETGGGR